MFPVERCFCTEKWKGYRDIVHLPQALPEDFFIHQMERMSYMDLEHLTFAKRFDAISGSAIREILKLTAQPGMISFAGGNPARSALPDETVARISKMWLVKESEPWTDQRRKK